MPKFSPLGALGSIRGFLSVVREVDFDEVRGRAETAPSILLVTDDPGRGEQAIQRLFGDDAIARVDLRTADFGGVDRSRYDLVCVLDPEGYGVLTEVQRTLGDEASQKLVFLKSDNAGQTDAQVVESRDQLVALNSDLTPALGRRFPELRLAAVKAIVDETAKANAQFSLISNVPAVVPFIGGLVAASADLIVLTKNQVMMVYKIAAAHEKDLGDQMRIMRELAPVVGSGFVWRTVAREAASFLPLAAGTVPKVAIAYVGTVVLGRAADYYYRYGQKPTREHLREFTKRASETASRLRISRQDEVSVDQAALDRTDKSPGN
ncbi:MAG: hypothetical protein H0U38_04415 [Chloroflexia bacterium]|jgi:uncharacterized protein (DUF697 family)|nr:hypothetical protein [Chloroflexia bacterium]